MALRVRPVREADLDSLMVLAGRAGKGMSTLPPDRTVLRARIANSCVSFAAEVPAPADEQYLLVLEDMAKNVVVGTAGIFASVGVTRPFLTFHRVSETRYSEALGVSVDTELLRLSAEYRGYSEVATLFLAPEYRNGGNGKLLSRARYLMMAQFRTRFAECVIAELRGWQDRDGAFPFWRDVIQPFFRMAFDEADNIYAHQGNRFIAELLPEYPFYFHLLSAPARHAVGRPNDDGIAAMKILEREGFQYRNHIDVFDGGPIVEAPVDKLTTVRMSRTARVSVGDNIAPGDARDCLISNADIGRFRVVRAPLVADAADTAILSADTAAALSVENGDTIRYVTD